VLDPTYVRETADVPMYTGTLPLDVTQWLWGRTPETVLTSDYTEAMAGTGSPSTFVSAIPPRSPASLLSS